MNWAHRLTREELLTHGDAFRDAPEFAALSASYLRDAVEQRDLALAEALLKAGANPNVPESWGDSLLDYLVYEYRVEHTANGTTFLKMAELLLAHGADPNAVGSCNWRAIDRAIEHGSTEFVELFVRYGAAPEQREFV
jgi:Ankyrin repeats (many copies)